MTDHHYDQHDNDPTPLDHLTTDEVLLMRNDAYVFNDRARTLHADNELDTRLELADFSEGRRRTCGACGSWADHVHDPLTDEPMKVARWDPTFTRADVAHVRHIAWQVFALAGAAPRSAWEGLEDGFRITVVLESSYYCVRVPVDDDTGRPGTAWIESYRRGPAGGLRPPVIYANARAAAAIADAFEYAAM
ncbi:hypothetical protein K7711_02740 [Nocardia sp. CA2R105]|uniref:hypothetical protein n=1 Tax=Nocardia coffeae TaxID=2873381 RepID=UPI001CA76A9F|nr:hypothetical protein [Nocardia coffeae]MBY8855384.1 hypothetical protein [Nocardia coffeae]